MIAAVLVQHVILDEGQVARDARAHLRDLFLGQRERGVADEVLVVEQHGDDVLVARHEPDRRLAVDAGLTEDGIVLAHAREDVVRPRPELVAVEVVLAGR